MKFRCSVDIDLPRPKVIEIFDNPDNMKHWQDGFISFEHYKGEPGKSGAESRIKYNINGREMELIETVLVRNLPDEMSGTYESKHTFNHMRNYFKEIDLRKTRWEAEIEYTELRGLMMKIMSRIAPGMFKKQTQKWMDQFKAFAEKKASE